MADRTMLSAYAASALKRLQPAASPRVARGCTGAASDFFRDPSLLPNYRLYVSRAF
jgi:hypothetical protein